MNPAYVRAARASRPRGTLSSLLPVISRKFARHRGPQQSVLSVPAFADPRVAAMGAGPSQEAAVWPTGWCVASIAAPASLAHCEPVPLAHRSEIPAEQRLVARQAILQISTVPREEFLAIETEHYCISHDDWSFEAYHGAAAAAVQEDKGLNRMIYCIVPRRAAPPVA